MVEIMGQEEFGNTGGFAAKNSARIPWRPTGRMEMGAKWLLSGPKSAALAEGSGDFGEMLLK